MKPDFELEQIRLFNCDCMDFMREVPDRYYELAIVDPPYGIKIGINGKVGEDNCAPCKQYKPVKWDNNSPKKEYFDELFRISKNQIIFGANHFISKMPYDSSCWLIWNKDNGKSNFSDAELAWGSFKTAIRIFKFRWNGMLQENMKEKEYRIHPTQKPIQLYKWLLTNYAKRGDKIFDSHGGSFSSACACLDMGFEFDGCELDKEYFDNAVERINNHSQLYLDI
jgi:site-specific DNA-methyltransferase (adenine-specific)